MTLQDFVLASTERGECNCGQCADRGNKPDPRGHAIDNGFFVVAKRGTPTAEDFRAFTRGHRGEFNEVDVFDGKEHGYMELGGWLGDQGLALQYMALGALLGVFDLMTPRTMLSGLDEDLARQMAGAGYVAIKAKPVEALA